MTVEQWLKINAEKLKRAGVELPLLDAQIILGFSLSKDRSWLLAHPEHMLDNTLTVVANESLKKRLNHMPVAYIVGESEFYGRKFAVNEHTLQPRPETEIMIELLIDKFTNNELLPNSSIINIIDVGTGTGALGITAALELNKLMAEGSMLKAYLIDIDQKCINLAKQNAKQLGIDATFYQGNLLEPLLNGSRNEELRTTKNEETDSPFAVHRSPFVILANLPYVPDSHAINKAAMHEPKHAIFGGPDGLDYYRDLYYQIAKFSQFDSNNIIVFTESLPAQHAELKSIAVSAGFKQTTISDFIQVFESA
ncbi:MAG: peptide chain release factor N(5)-glutamine methyltransferase [bacterium]|nr:peptide chain release factor N(5)-glutamine methyltransferase [bacterium]